MEHAPERSHALIDVTSLREFFRDSESLNRYRLANRHAARFCRQLEHRFLRSRRVRAEAWLEAVSRFYRLGAAGKIRQVSYA